MSSMASGDSFRRASSNLPVRHMGATSEPVLVSTTPGSEPRSRADFEAFDESFVRYYASARRSATDALLRSLPRVNNGDVLEGASAVDYLVDLRQKLVEATTDAARHYDSRTWLELIRRLTPHALAFAEYGTMRPQGDSIQRVAENLVGTAQGTYLDLTSPRVPVDVSMRLARLMALAAEVNNLENAIRSAGKGMKYQVARTRRPRPYDSEELSAALDEFDLRSNRASVDHATRLEEIDVDDFDADPPLLVAYRFHPGLAADQAWDGPFRSAPPREEVVKFTVRSFTTGDEKYTALGHGGVLASFDQPEAVASLMIFGNALLLHVLDYAEDAGNSLPHTGLLKIDAEEFLSCVHKVLERPRVAAWLAEAGQRIPSADQVLAHVQGKYVHGRRSFPGPILQQHDTQITVDVWAYAWHVTHELKLSPQTGGAVANLSAEQFELATQELIDKSVLAPPRELRELRGRTLRLNGKSITDADALIVADKKLFLVSCKKFLIRADYLAGEYTVVRNGATRLNAALDEWRERISTLRASPVGDNYDFSGYEIDGFVLLPELVFTPRSDSRELLRFGRRELYFTRVESYSQFATVLEMAGWSPEPAALRAVRLRDDQQFR